LGGGVFAAKLCVGGEGWWGGVMGWKGLSACGEGDAAPACVMAACGDGDGVV